MLSRSCTVRENLSHSNLQVAGVLRLVRQRSGSFENLASAASPSLGGASPAMSPAAAAFSPVLLAARR
jgi:hypothetical protein